MHTGDQRGRRLLGALVGQHCCLPAGTPRPGRCLHCCAAGQTRSCEFPGVAGSVLSHRGRGLQTGPAGLALMDSPAHTCLSSRPMSAHAVLLINAVSDLRQAGVETDAQGAAGLVAQPRGARAQPTAHTGAGQAGPLGSRPASSPPLVPTHSSVLGPRNRPGGQVCALL